MKRWLLGVCMLLQACATPAMATDAPPAVSSFLPPTVEIYTDDMDASGMIVAPGRILTARHAVEGAGDQQIMVRFTDGKTVPATVIWRADSTDAALLSADTKGYPQVSLACSVAPVGTEIVMVGAPMGLTNVMTWGHIASPDPAHDAPWLRIMDITTVPGNSGGPVFNLGTGEVVGMADAVVDLGAARGGRGSSAVGIVGLGLMIPSDILCKFSLKL